MILHQHQSADPQWRITRKEVHMTISKRFYAIFPSSQMLDFKEELLALSSMLKPHVT